MKKANTYFQHKRQEIEELRNEIALDIVEGKLYQDVKNYKGGLKYLRKRLYHYIDLLEYELDSLDDIISIGSSTKEELQQ